MIHRADNVPNACTWAFLEADLSARSGRLRTDSRCGDLTRVSEEVFQSKPLSAVRLLGHTLERMRLAVDNRLAWSVISQENFTDSEASDEETEGFVNELLFIDTVQIAAILREPKPGKIRCSLRSRGDYDVAAVTRSFGGGGHRNAAGCTFDASLEEAEALLVAKMKQCLASS